VLFVSDYLRVVPVAWPGKMRVSPYYPSGNCVRYGGPLGVIVTEGVRVARESQSKMLLTREVDAIKDSVHNCWGWYILCNVFRDSALHCYKTVHQ